WCERRAAHWGGAIERETPTEPLAAEMIAEEPDLIAALDWSLGGDQRPAIELLAPLAQSWAIREAAFSEVRAVASRVLARFEAGSPEWLEALAPVAELFVFGIESVLIPSWCEASV